MKGEEGGRRKVLKRHFIIQRLAKFPLTLIIASCCKSNTYCPKNDWRSRDGAEDDERPEGNC